ncbi:MAG: alpha-amylase [Anaerolineae bacterium]|nr:alpha-amylase [Anaerolineae bacterium]
MAAIGFELFAPYNENVRLMGSWNDWDELAMSRDDKGVWRVEVDLPDGDYEYKFRLISKSFFAVDQEKTVADPKSIQMTLDSHENSIIRIRNGQRIIHEYQWQHDDVPLPSNDQLIIYELHVGDFRGGPGDTDDQPGTFDRVIEKLDYLAGLGINAIELMPVNEFPGHHSWGYSQRSIYAIENSYGTPDDLCRLVDECHARGIRMIHDAVYNHMESEAPLTQIDYTYWFYEDNPDEPALEFGPKFNYEKYDENLGIWPAREHVIEALHYWVQTYHIDGIRFDCTRAIKYFDLLQWFYNEAHSRANFKPFFTVAEHIPQDPMICGPNGPMDAAWHDTFYRQLECSTLGVSENGRNPYNTTELLRVLSGVGDGFVAPVNAVHYLNNHDEQRIMWKLGEVAKTFDEAAFRRAKLGATLLLMAPGLPMLWMGQEFGEPTSKTLAPNPLHWNLLDNPTNVGLFEHYKHLIHLRRGNPAIWSSNYEAVADIPDRGIIAFKRWNDAGNQVLVVANLKDQFAGNFELHNQTDGVWRECIYGYEVTIQGGYLGDSLAESDVKVYIKQG